MNPKKLKKKKQISRWVPLSRLNYYQQKLIQEREAHGQAKTRLAKLEELGQALQISGQELFDDLAAILGPWGKVSEIRNRIPDTRWLDLMLELEKTKLRRISEEMNEMRIWRKAIEVSQSCE